MEKPEYRVEARARGLRIARAGQGISGLLGYPGDDK
jgi:hypothetical protein